MAGGETVLVLEDNQAVRTFVKMVLQEQGFRVVEAYAGWKALQLAESAPPDVLLLDWQLPDISGLDVLRALRAGRCQAPAILMTAFGSEELAIVALRLGVRDYLQKPFGPDDLIKAVEGALAEARLRHERDALLAQLRQTAQGMDEYARHLARARDLLVKLARLTDELERSKPEIPKAYLDETRRYIREIGKILERPHEGEGRVEYQSKG
jgi:DNA-binding response OmpR family regulator